MCVVACVSILLLCEYVFLILCVSVSENVIVWVFLMDFVFVHVCVHYQLCKYVFVIVFVR